MELYLCDIRKIDAGRINELSDERRKKAEHLKIADDKRRCIAGGLLLNRLLPNKEIRVNEHGKPFAEGGRCFNLSHSGDYVLLALSDGKVGCDIQKIKYIKADRIAKYGFCRREREALKSSADKLSAFYSLWTKKESLLKCMGTGFSRNAKTVDVSGESFEENGRRYYFKVYNFSDYVISVCSLSDKFPEMIEFVDC